MLSTVLLGWQTISQLQCAVRTTNEGLHGRTE